MKRIIGVSLAAIMVLGLVACGESSSEDKVEKMDEYITENLDYELSQLIVREEEGEDGYYFYGQTEDYYDYSEVGAYVESFVSVTEAAASENDAQIYKIEAVLRTGGSTYIGWDSDTENIWTEQLGTDGSYLAENVALSDIQSAVNNFYEEKNEEDKDESVDFGDSLDAYQGTWRSQEDSNETVVVNGEKLTEVVQETSGGKNYVDTSEYKFGLDDDGNLVCNMANYDDITVYFVSIDDDGNLVLTGSGTNGTDHIYTKESDNTIAPAETYDPEIGMTESEVRGSTWGSPNRINTTTSQYSETEQWVYDFGYIYFTDGVVTSIQETN